MPEGSMKSVPLFSQIVKHKQNPSDSWIFFQGYYYNNKTHSSGNRELISSRDVIYFFHII
jgi:hypothetical protein